MSNIEIKRGNTAKYKFQRKDNEGNPILTKADKVYFTVKEESLPSVAIFQKTIDNMEFDEEGIYHFIIEPEDTERLNFGRYVYDIKVIQDDIKSTIAQGKFEVKKIVTFKGNEV